MIVKGGTATLSEYKAYCKNLPHNSIHKVIKPTGGERKKKMQDDEQCHQEVNIRASVMIVQGQATHVGKPVKYGEF